MTKAEFTDWLQDVFDLLIAEGEVLADSARDDLGDIWRHIEEKELLQAVGVPYALDYLNHDILFGLADGFLASGYEVGAEGATIWFFPEADVSTNLREARRSDVEDAAVRLEAAALCVRDLLRGPVQ
jgi:hypothetical protein